MNQSIEAKVVVIGATGVGKTSLIHRCVGRKFDRTAAPTIGASYFNHQIRLDNTLVQLRIWDTAGQERFKSMAPMYYRNADVAVVVFDITSRHSFVESQAWVKELRRNIEEPIIVQLVGNKSDLAIVRTVGVSEATSYATSIRALYYETSALTDAGIQDVFLSAASQLVSDSRRHRFDSQRVALPSNGYSQDAPSKSLFNSLFCCS